MGSVIFSDSFTWSGVEKRKGGCNFRVIRVEVCVG